MEDIQAHHSTNFFGLDRKIDRRERSFEEALPRCGTDLSFSNVSRYEAMKRKKQCGILRSTMADYTVPQCTMVFYGLLWNSVHPVPYCTLAYHYSILQHTEVCSGISWCFMAYQGVVWRALVKACMLIKNFLHAPKISTSWKSAYKVEQKDVKTREFFQYSQVLLHELCCFTYIWFFALTLISFFVVTDGRV